MGKTYVGNSSDIAKQVKSIYVGDGSNIARKIKRAYAGDPNGIARLIYEESGILPAEYQQVEYLESTGTQMITTDYSVQSTDIMTVDFLYRNATSSSTQHLFGAGHNGASSGRVFSIGRTTNGIYLGLGQGYRTVNGGTSRHTAILDSANIKMYLDGTERSFMNRTKRACRCAFSAIYTFIVVYTCKSCFVFFYCSDRTRIFTRYRNLYNCFVWASFYTHLTFFTF